MKKGIVVIPARYKSSRFPGKPLAILDGKPLVKHVYDLCVQAVGKDKTFIATDAQEIQEVVKEFGGNCIMTSESNLTGTDRIAEVARKLKYDFYINVQGDEPFINHEDIKAIFSIMENDDSNVLNCYCEIRSDEMNDYSVPKVVFSDKNDLIYISRGDIPFNKNGMGSPKYKQVCIYGFNHQHLREFSNCKSKMFIEANEDIEIIRFLELGIKVKMVKVKNVSIAVDTPEDLIIAEKFIKSINEEN
tara:strand:- start:393 stop:1130 length:738 start_codon:yes stop_codon:yes gene_type:complete